VSEALAQLDKYEQLLSEMRVSKSNQLNDKIYLMYIETSDKEVQIKVDLEIVVKETKMGLLLRVIADTNKIITDDESRY
jgi:hypothetical protein